MRKIILVMMMTLALSSSAFAKTWMVDNFMKENPLPQGEQDVAGVVTEVFEQDHKFGMIDTRKVSCCGTQTCEATPLPVLWSGKMPAAKDKVKVTGEIAQEGGKSIFKAKSVVKIEDK